jgi:hypothetical protein
LFNSRDCATCPRHFLDPVLVTLMLSCWMLSRFGHSRKEKGKQRVTGYVPYQPLLQEMAHLMPLRRTRY